MNRLLICMTGVAFGGAAGVTATWLLLHEPAPVLAPRPAITQAIFRDLPKMSDSEAETHRQNRFADINTLEETLRLPSDFDQTEALYVVVGRADSAGIQDLIYQAEGVVDVSDRRAALSILFSRLADIDPRSALAVAAQAPFNNEQNITSAIWRTWSRRDLDGALAAARNLSPQVYKANVARTLYWAQGLDDPAVVQRIEDVIGLPPDRWVRAQHIAKLADGSPRFALDYIEALDNQQLRHESIAAFGEHVGRNQPNQAGRIAAMIDNLMLRNSFESNANNAIARHSPERVIEQSLNDPSRAGFDNALAMAAMEIANSDPKRTMDYYQQARPGSRLQQMLAAGIAQNLARTDPERALEWAREAPAGQRQQVLMQTIMQIAAVDPELAMAAASEAEAGGMRDSVFGMIISAKVQTDPVAAIGLLDKMQDGRQKSQAARQLAMTWGQVDPEAAFRWASDNRSRYGDGPLHSAATMLIQTNPRAAIPLLSRVDDATAGNWRAMIASQIAQTESPEAAIAFVGQYRNSPEFPQMQANLVMHIANSDMTTAKSMADQMPAGTQRDNAMVNLISQQALNDPSAAVAWLDSISGQQGRAMATASLAASWARNDPDGASQWVRSLPAGNSRDDAILAMLGRRYGALDFPTALVDSIGDETKRSQANLTLIFQVANHDRERARTMLGNMDLTPQHRQQAEQAINQSPAFSMAPY